MARYEDDYYYNEHDENQVKKILKSKKKKKLKKRIKILLFLLFVIALGAFFFSDYSKVKSIQVVGNEEVKSQDILDHISLNRDSIYLFVDKKKVAQEIKEVGMIKRASVSIDLIGHVVIEIEEAEKVAYCEIGNHIYVIDELGGVSETEDKAIIKSLQSCPQILEFKDLKFLKQFAKEYVKIPELIKNQTSDIIYSPESGDQTRLEFIMDNGKTLYLRVEDMADQLARIDYEAFMTGYSDRCVFSFEGEHIYMKKCE